MVRIPADLLKRIDQAARKKAISRSSFIVSSMADLVNGEP
jgi:metal-responsive CopG/Arc/MetJ family transcriptional regulator